MNGSLDREALNDALKQLRRFGRKTAGDAVFTFTPDEVVIEWAGMGQRVPGNFDRETTQTVRIAWGAMKTLCKTPVPGDKPIAVSVADGRLEIDRISFACIEDAPPAPQLLLPINARPFHIAMLPHLYSAETIEAAGLADRVVELRERQWTSVERAARSLAWLGITDDDVMDWLDTHLDRLANGKKPSPTNDTKPKIVILDKDGQVELL